MIERHPEILIDYIRDPISIFGYKTIPRWAGYSRCDCLMKVGAICYQVGIPFPQVEENLNSPTIMYFRSKADAMLFKAAETR